MKSKAVNKALKVPSVWPGIEVTRYHEKIYGDYMKELQDAFDYQQLNFLIGYEVPNQFRPKRRTAAEWKKYERVAEYLEQLFMEED
ncbi:hypothetical protein [Chitinophaga tropicalis]|uniref:Uncharacterized protein n=1 Tax=Chitinophaga tropicalis TaxID=2683588 RepID=A0A7K1U578_9BACT|nr:hypothetical protein [Chitinophaga tropicalis]MVT09511.1 hypothetical protein [Chitinophaga tropicalis]